MAKKIERPVNNLSDTVTIPREDYRNLVAIKSRTEGMVDFAMNTRYATVDDCLLVLGVRREREEINPIPEQD